MAKSKVKMAELGLRIAGLELKIAKFGSKWLRHSLK